MNTKLDRAESLTCVKDGISVVRDYALVKKLANEQADLKVNLAIVKNKAVVHIAGSDSEYTDLKLAKAYICRVTETVVAPTDHEFEMAVAS